MTDLRDAAVLVRENAHAPYSNFKVGAAIRTASGAVFSGCNVENVAYPQGTCAEAGDALRRLPPEICGGFGLHGVGDQGDRGGQRAADDHGRPASGGLWRRPYAGLTP